MAYNPKDRFFKQAKEENYAARSVYKLKEIDQRHRLLKNGQFVIDLGAAPGSWSQFISEKIGSQGRVLSIDLTEVQLKLPNVIFLQQDIHEVDFKELRDTYNLPEKADVVVSDMAPKTTGIRLTDQARSLELCEMALNVACEHLKTGGHFVCKLFHSDEFSAFKKKLQTAFQKVDVVKPESTRKISKEIFLVGIHLKYGKTNVAT